MIENNEQGIIDKSFSKDEKFIQEIMAKKRVYISRCGDVESKVTYFCQMDPNLDLIVNKKMLGFSGIMAFAFKLDFDQKIIDKFNKM